MPSKPVLPMRPPQAPPGYRADSKQKAMANALRKKKAAPDPSALGSG